MFQTCLYDSQQVQTAGVGFLVHFFTHGFGGSRLLHRWKIYWCLASLDGLRGLQKMIIT